MNRASLLGLTLVLPALGAAFFACQKEDPRPPVSDGPGTFNPSGGKGAGGDGATGDGGVVGAFASFPGFQPSGLFADGDTAYLTLVAIDTAQPGEVVRVDSAGVITVLVNDAVTPSAPTVEPGFLFYLDKNTASSSDLKKIDLSNVAAGATNVATGFEQPSASFPKDSVSIAVASSSGGTGMEVDAITIASGSSTPIASLAGEFSPGDLIADTQYFYFAAKGVAGGQINRVLLSGAPSENLWSGGTGTIGGMTASDGTVYFALDQGAASGVIYAVPSFNPAFVIASGIDTPTDVVVVQGYVYIASNAPAGGIYRASLDAEAGLPVEPVLVGGAVSRLAVGSTVLYGAADQALVRVQ